MTADHDLSSELSDTHRALVQSAVEEGYFKIPREISTVELADKHGMSSREASEELNRALDVILRNAAALDE
jgi:predicted DNA binding protein